MSEPRAEAAAAFFASRWVIYSGKVFDSPFQSTSIPPTWNSWIHQIDDRPPASGDEVLDPCTANFIVPGAEKSSIAMYDHVKPVSIPPLVFLGCSGGVNWPGLRAFAAS